jgi:hypothetical protein
MIIGYGSLARPISATCGRCGEQIHTPEDSATSSEKILEQLAVQFDLHVRQKHGSDPD